METIERFINEAVNLPPVPLKASTAHQNHLKEMTAFVDETLSRNPNINSLIGHNPLQMMYDNHRHHSALMSTVFLIGSYRMLAGILPWVYRSYHAHNFSYDYFPLELKTWILAGEKYLANEEMVAIRKVYAWMIARHEQIIFLSQQDSGLEAPMDAQWLALKNEFREAVLCSDHLACLKLAMSTVKTSADIEGFYLQVLQPVLYEVGTLWEKAKISVAQEHLASAIVSRVMASVHLVERTSIKSYGKAVIAASPNEYHEIGASMISDILEHDGWDVAYLGGNVPRADLLQYLCEFSPELLALSVTIPFNVNRVKEIIAAIRSDETLREIKVMVGGRAFNDNEDLWQLVGADGFAANLSEMRHLAQSWRRADN